MKGFKFGDIVENGWAGDTNPNKRLIFIKFGHRASGGTNPGKHFVSMDVDGRRIEHSAGEEHKMRVVGSIFGCDCLAELKIVLATRKGDPDPHQPQPKGDD